MPWMSWSQVSIEFCVEDVILIRLKIFIERDIKCKDAIVSLYDLVGNLEIKQTGNVSYPGLPNRTTGALLLNYVHFVRGIVGIPQNLVP